MAQAATEYSVSFCIPEDQVADTVRFLHRELGLEGGRGEGREGMEGKEGREGRRSRPFDMGGSR